mmetsp:Transcript_115193/g.332757  ORF Transcript_115193/g.332757 Transcript_115193/m.332757 type:complete len:247 (+) Transcript_115193:118-858(+)
MDIVLGVLVVHTWLDVIQETQEVLELLMRRHRLHEPGFINPDELRGHEGGHRVPGDCRQRLAQAILIDDVARPLGDARDAGDVQAAGEHDPTRLGRASSPAEECARWHVAHLAHVADIVGRLGGQVLEDVELDEAGLQALELELRQQLGRQILQHRVLLRVCLPGIVQVPQERLDRGLQVHGCPAVLQISHVHADLRQVIIESPLPLGELEERLCDERDADRESREREEHEHHDVHTLGLILRCDL